MLSPFRSVADTASLDLNLSVLGVLSGTVLPAGIDHNSLANLTTGDPHTQYFKVSGRTNESLTLTGTGQLLAAAGTAAAPSISYSGSPDTGLYFSAADKMDVTIDGLRRWSFGDSTTNASLVSRTDPGDSSGYLGWNTDSAASYGKIGWDNAGIAGVALMRFSNFSTVGSASWRYFDNSTMIAQLTGGTTPSFFVENYFTTRGDGATHPPPSATLVRWGGFDVTAGVKTLSLAVGQAVGAAPAAADASLIIYINGVKYKLHLTVA